MTSPLSPPKRENFIFEMTPFIRHSSSNFIFLESLIYSILISLFIQVILWTIIIFRYLFQSEFWVIFFHFWWVEFKFRLEFEFVKIERHQSAWQITTFTTKAIQWVFEKVIYVRER